MQLNILRNLETWRAKNKTAFAIKYLLQIPHRPFIATDTESKVLGMFFIMCFSLTVSKDEPQINSKLIHIFQIKGINGTFSNGLFKITRDSRTCKRPLELI